MSLAHDTSPRTATKALRHDWTRAEVRALFALPFPELMFRAALVHRENFDPTEVQISTLLSIKTGGCPEDCAYCPQSAQYDTGVEAHKFLGLDAGVVLRGLRTIGAILRAAAGLDRQQGRDLHFGRIEILPVRQRRAEHQLRKRQREQCAHLLARPVVAERVRSRARPSIVSK